MSVPILNKVRERLLFLSPTVQAGWEPESRKEDFEELKVLGQGAFGKVVKVSHKKTNIVYAMKIVEKSMLKQTNMVEQMVNEVKIMYSLNHPYILKLYNHFEDDLKIYLVLEIAPGGQLYAVLWRQPQKRFNEKMSAKFILQLTLALENVHSKNIIHRDIKPENLLLDEQSNIKVADFGWSNFLKPNEIRQTFCGTLDYLAPEMLDRQHKHDHTVDIWSIGVLTYELLTGQSPFAPKENQTNPAYVEQKTKENIKTLKFTFPPSFPEGAKDLIEKILVKDPAGRYTCEQIRTHSWIKENTKDVKIPASITMELEKRKIVQSQEVDSLQKEGKVAFTNEEIYQYSRPDSILVRDVPNKDDSLKEKVRILETRLLDADLDNKKKQAEIDSLKQQIEVLKSGNVSSEVLGIQQKMKLADDRYLQEKNRHDQEVKKNLELERKLKDLSSQLDELKDMKEQISQLKAKNKQQKEEIDRLKNSNLKTTSGVPQQQFGTSEGGGVNDLLEKLKQKHGDK